MQRAHLLRMIEAACIWLFFLQALRVIFSVLFGIIYDQVFEGPIDSWLLISIGLVVLAFALPAAAPRMPGPIVIVILAAITVISRLGLSINDPQVRYWSALLVLAAGGLYLTSLLTFARRVVLPAFVTALVLDQSFRVVGHTYDVTLKQSWLPIQIIWSILLLGVIIWLGRSLRVSKMDRGSPGITWGLTIGAVLFLETSLLSLPNVQARWADTSYELIAPLLLLFTFPPLIAPIRRSVIPSLCTRSSIRALLFGLLVIAIQIGYFTTGLFAAGFLLLSQLILIILVVCIFDSASDQQTRVGLGIALGLLLFFLLNLFNTLSFTYPYTLPFIRGMGWVVYLIACGGVSLSGLIRYKPKRVAGVPVVRPVWAILFVAFVLVIAVISVWPQEVDPFPQNGDVIAGTYNIHYGYDELWHLSLEAQAKTIEEHGVDIVALQEVDTGRMTSYGIDNAYYLARRLRMNVVYLPTVEHLTGIALLHHGVATETGGQWVTSTQEQTGIVYAQLNSDQIQVHAFGTWSGLSNEDTLTQINEALAYIGDRSPAVFGGDFNSEPDSPVARAIEAAGFVDPFVVLGIDPAPLTSPAIRPEKRIDFVWVRDVKPADAWVPGSVASDHRMVAARVKARP